jgi:site-specific recombinase XerD
MTSTIKEWDSNPMRCFKSFVVSMDFIETSPRMVGRDFNKPISAQSAETYLLMFGKFTRWLAGQGKRFSAVTHYDLLMFLELGTVIGTKRVPDLQSKITFRYLRLIERCYIYLQMHPNPAQHAIFDAVRGQKIGRDKEMVVLSTDQLRQFVSALPYSANPGHWKRRRDRSMQLVMLYAGLKVAEAIGLLLKEVASQVELNGSLKLSITPEHKHSTSYEHDTFLHPDAVKDVLAWVDERQGLLIPGGRLFPANLNGDALDKATVYRQVKATFTRAQIQIHRSGGRTLRNTFAVQEIKSGIEPAVLTSQLGLALERSTETYALAEAKTT